MSSTPAVTLVSLLLLLYVVAASTVEGGGGGDSFHEELLLQPLPNGDLLAHFRFATLTEPALPEQHRQRRDFHLFPRALGELVQHHALRELDVSLARGVWRDGAWGRAPGGGGGEASGGAPAGAKVAAWFDESTTTDVDAAWRRLTNALAGQLCASLNFLDSQTSVSPRWAFRPAGVTQQQQQHSTNEANASFYFRLGMLPGENVCTENLSPWKKLLPCESRRGLATLLNAKSIHQTKYHLLGLSLRHVCAAGGENAGCARTSIEFVQTATLVFSPDLWSENYDKKVTSWSVRSLFGIGLTSTCPLATSSRIYVDNSDGELTFGGDLSSQASESFRQGAVLAFEMEKLLTKGSTNIVVNRKRNSTRSLVQLPPPVLQVTRFLAGHGQAEGEVVTRIKNPSKSSVSVIFLDVLPWYLRLYFHTLKVVQNGHEIKPKASVLVPGVDRARPYSLELLLQLPPKSVTTVSINFEKSILKWLEYPPDANHGFYVGPAVITAILPDGGDANPTYGFTVARSASSFYETLAQQEKSTGEPREPILVRLYTETLLVNLPTPDFSMPYNVICLTCTVVALAFGPLHNITTKQLVMEEEGEGKKTFLGKLMDLIPFRKKKATPVPEVAAEDEANDEVSGDVDDDK